MDCITVQQWDAAADPDASLLNSFDRVVCDVPCSGLGVIRRKPEIRYKKSEEFADLPALQLQILEQGAKMVRPGGVLQYSTCTLRLEENQEVVQTFLDKHPEFAPRALVLESCFTAAELLVSHEITLFPHIHGTDGFYIAGFTKNQ